MATIVVDYNLKPWFHVFSLDREHLVKNLILGPWMLADIYGRVNKFLKTSHVCCNKFAGCF